MTTTAPSAAQGMLKTGVKYETYATWDGERASHILPALRSMAHYRYALLHPSESSPDQATGTATHFAVLEPDEFHRRYVVPPKVDKRTTPGKAEWKLFLEQFPDREHLTKEQYDAALGMKDAVWRHPLAAELLASPGVNEVAWSWDDRESGLRCKARADTIRKCTDGWTRVIDLKTTKDARREAFERSIVQFGYAEQAAHYLDGLDTLRGEVPRRFCIIAVETFPPYELIVHELSEEALEYGRKRRARALAAIAQARETDYWPGYSTALNYISVPAWSLKQEDLI
jgi:hypothetical protein